MNREIKILDGYDPRAVTYASRLLQVLRETYGDDLRIQEEAHRIVEKLYRRQVNGTSRRKQSKSRRRYVPPETRVRVFENDKYRCRKCGSHIDLTIDHIIPVAHGGTNTFTNLQTLCAPCNRIKADQIIPLGH